MDAKRFDIGEAVQFGWETLKANLGFFVLVVLIFWVVEGVFSVPQYFAARSVAPVFLFSILSFVASIFIAIATIKVSLPFTYGETADFNDLYNGYTHFLNILLGGILYALIVIGGLILLIVPGIIWAIKYQFFGYLVIDQNMDAVAAIKRSGVITRGSKGNLFLFWLAALGLNLVGLLACGIGLFATIPTVWVANAYIYRKLLYAQSVAETPGESAQA